jgi:hypothetical protein
LRSKNNTHRSKEKEVFDALMNEIALEDKVFSNNNIEQKENQMKFANLYDIPQHEDSKSKTTSTSNKWTNSSGFTVHYEHRGRDLKIENQSSENTENGAELRIEIAEQNI